jgi:methyltransferase-like protein
VSDLKVNSRIVNGLTIHCGDDHVLKEFLMSIIWAEVKNPFRYRDLYREEIKKCMEKRGQKCEN